MTVRSFYPDAHAIAAARFFVSNQLGHHPRCDDALLIVSELATNAIVHAQTTFDVSIQRGRHIRIEVRDADDGFRAGEVDGRPAARRGHGLQIIESLATRWGVDSTQPHGKSVWVEL